MLLKLVNFLWEHIRYSTESIRNIKNNPLLKFETIKGHNLKYKPDLENKHYLLELQIDLYLNHFHHLVLR